MPPIKTIPRPDGGQPRRAKEKRYCIECGKIVCSYKNPRATMPLCYACEDKLPWTYELIVGRAHSV